VPSEAAQREEETMKYTGAEIIVKLLERQGVEFVAGIPGGAALPLYEALSRSEIRHVLARHEQGAGFIAQGAARVSGKPMVCLASSGPGATNLLTAVADAKMDSIPLIAITGQVPTSLIGTDAFQEADTFGLMLPITKHNWMVRSVEELLEIIPEAFRLAMSGRPGPVSIDVPKDVQQATMEIDEWPEPGTRIDTAPAIDTTALDQALALIAEAKRPMLMIGGGVINAECSEDVLALAQQQDLPSVASFMGLGVLPNHHPLFLGMLGMHGARYTNMALEECDLLIAAGVRFDDRATGDPAHFVPNARIIHIDIDAGELNKIKPATLAIQADIGEAVRYLFTQGKVSRRPEWRKRIDALRRAYPLIIDEADGLFSHHGLLRTVAELAPADSTVVTDVGQHQMWTAQVYPFSRPRQWISSGGLGTMGFGLPAAIGAALREPGRTVLCISGDGSLMMNLQELDTLAEHGLPVKLIVMNNQHLGLVKQQQKLFYGSRYHGIRNQRSLDFTAVARAMGIEGIDLQECDDPAEDLRQALNTAGPSLINVPIDPEAMVFPMVPSGAANREMILQDPEQDQKEAAL